MRSRRSRTRRGKTRRTKQRGAGFLSSLFGGKPSNVEAAKAAEYAAAAEARKKLQAKQATPVQ